LNQRGLLNPIKPVYDQRQPGSVNTQHL